MIRRILTLSLLLWLVLFPIKSFGADTICLCDNEETCAYPTSQTKNVGDSWTQYADWSCTIDGGFCTATASITLKIYVSGAWTNVSSSTPIKLTSGVNPSVKVSGKSDGCDPTTTPRVYWGLQVNTGASGNYNMGVWSNYGYATFTITVPAAASRRVMTIE